MLDVSNNGIISIVRGDTVVYNFMINLGTVMMPRYYRLQKNEYLRFYLTEPNMNVDSNVIYKEYSIDDMNEDGSVNIKLSSDDTTFLEREVYYYTIKLIRNGEVDTLVNKTKFLVRS